MMHTGWIWEIVTWMSLPALPFLAGILVWRKLHREFPFFLSYLVISEVVTLVRFAAQFASAWTYFYTFWISELVVMIFTFLTIYELFLRRIFPQSKKVRFYRFLFPFAFSVILVLGWMTALVARDRRAAFLIESRVLDFILVGVLAFFVSLMLVMGRHWTKYDFGIAFGFAIIAATFLFTSAIWVRSNYRSTNVDQLPLIAFDITCILWLYCFATGSRVGGSPNDRVSPEMVQQARTWETMLKAWLASGRNKR